MTKNRKFLSMFLVSFNFSFFHLLSHILVQVQNEGFHHQSHSSPPQKLFSLRSFRNSSAAVFPLRIWSERAPCWFLHQYRVLSRNCKQESLRANARQISDKMLTQVLKVKNFLESYNQKDLKFSHETLKQISGFRIGGKNYIRRFICECQYILAPEKYGGAQHWTLDKDMKDFSSRMQNSIFFFNNRYQRKREMCVVQGFMQRITA